MEQISKDICLRCGGKMISTGLEKIQLGQTSFLFGQMSNLFSGALRVEIWICAECSKMEFYSYEGVNDSEEESEPAQVECPNCGRMHDFDLPKCPHCKHRYYVR